MPEITGTNRDNKGDQMANESTEQNQGQQDQNQQAQNTSDQTQNGQQDQQGQQQRAASQQDDRSKWIPPHRFNEVNTKYQTEAQRAAALEAQLQQATQRIQALAGIQQRAPEELEMEEVRNALFKVHPALAKLSDEMVEKLVRIAENGDQLEETNKTIWRNHGMKMIRNAQDTIADRLNVESLTERQKQRIGREYVMYIEDLAKSGDTEIMRRHEAGDEKLIEEFAKAFLEDWQESIRKSVVTEATGPRRPIPSGRGRSVVVGTQKKKINYNNTEEFGNALVESFKDHGGTFGER